MAGVRVRLTDRDLEKLSKTPACWTILREAGQEAKQTAAQLAISTTVAASLWLEFVDVEGQPGTVELRAGSLAGEAAPYSRAFPAAMIETGTEHTPPQPFMHPAVEQAVRRRGGQMAPGRTRHRD